MNIYKLLHIVVLLCVLNEGLALWGRRRSSSSRSSSRRSSSSRSSSSSSSSSSRRSNSGPSSSRRSSGWWGRRRDQSSNSAPKPTPKPPAPAATPKPNTGGSRKTGWWFRNRRNQPRTNAPAPLTKATPRPPVSRPYNGGSTKSAWLFGKRRNPPGTKAQKWRTYGPAFLTKATPRPPVLGPLTEEKWKNQPRTYGPALLPKATPRPPVLGPLTEEKWKNQPRTYGPVPFTMATQRPPVLGPYYEEKWRNQPWTFGSAPLTKATPRPPVSRPYNGATPKAVAEMKLSANEEEEIEMIKEKLKQEEGVELVAYDARPNNPKILDLTIGIGFSLNRSDAEETIKKVLGDDVDFEKVKSGKQAITKDQVLDLFDHDIRNIYIPKAKYLVGKDLYDSLPTNVKIALVNAGYRGDIYTNTTDLMKQGNWEGAGKIYLQHRQYIEAEKGGELPGVKTRMDWNKKQFDTMIKQENHNSTQIVTSIYPGSPPLTPRPTD